jgi:hypothetical protein
LLFSITLFSYSIMNIKDLMILVANDLGTPLLYRSMSIKRMI